MTLTEWSLVYQGFDPAQERLREALCALGNGRFATRGAAPEAEADGVHYPGTYAAGCYNRLTSEVGDRPLEDESLVNLPNWLPLTFRIEDGDWFDLSAVELLGHRQELDLRRAVLTRLVRYRDAEGRETALTQRRLVSMANPHLAALQVTILPVNWSGRITIRSGLDGSVVNEGVERYRGLANRHLTTLEATAVDDDTLLLSVETNQSHIRIAEAARTRAFRGDRTVPSSSRVIEEPGRISLELDLELEQGVDVTTEKVAALCTTREPAISEPGLEARKEAVRAARFDELLAAHVLRWDELWDVCHFTVEDDGEFVESVLRLHIFHLLQTVSEHTVDIDAGIPARGLAGEAYRGHVFWDELFVFPFLNLRAPELTRALLRYRYRRLDEARRLAAVAGYAGAMYPWQSGADGREESPAVHLNPRSGRWIPDNSRLQRHITAAVAYNVWLYHQMTGDVHFLAYDGAEMFIEIARFWASIATYNPVLDCYEIRGVVGPDEYHDGYPDREQPGIDNNAYTNVMAAWVLWRAPDVLAALPEQRREQLAGILGLGREELDRWDEISRKMLVPFQEDGIISQFAGYDQLEELDWASYRGRYGNIQRLDRILEAEGDTVNRYKASKQADVLMLFYLLSAGELRQLFERLGYPFEYTTIPRNVEYYTARTSHGSTLSKVVHAWVLVRSDREASWDLLSDALESDISDIQGGTTPEGVHLGAMAGTVDLALRAYSGIEAREDVLWFNPALPEELSELRFTIRYRRHWGLEVTITSDHLTLSARPGPAPPIKVGLKEEVEELSAGATVEWGL